MGLAKPKHAEENIASFALNLSILKTHLLLVFLTWRVIRNYIPIALLLACGGGGGDSSISCPVLLSPSSCTPSLEDKVVKVTVDESDLCTGVILDNSRVLTAAHCVVEKDNVLVNGEPVSNITIHPNYRRDDQLGAFFFDLAILEFDSFSEKLEIGNGSKEDIVTAYGYGIAENGLAGTLQQGLLKISDLTPNHLVSVGSDNQAEICFGDSGGPVFKDGKLIGLISSGSQLACGGNDRVLITRVDVVEEWIEGGL